MNRRYIIIIAVLLAILAGTFWRGCQSTPGRIESHSPSLHSASPSSNIAPKDIKEPWTKEEYAARDKAIAIEFAKSNNAPIAFYGRVVDQDRKPLQGVTVDFGVNAIPMIPVLWGPDEKSKGSCVTDQNGFFSVEGKRGISLGVTSLKKPGYRESGYYNQAHVRYEPHGGQRHIPDRNKPVEFMLIRDDLPRAKEAYDKRLRLNWNAETTTSDFGPDIGKLEFTATRTGRDASNTMKKFEWEVKIRALGFTMAKLPDEYERMAPLEGYGAEGRVGFAADEKTWQQRPNVSYAIRTNSGAYGLMNLSIYGDGDNDGMSGSITIYLNKSGARNIDHN